jgi:hypothetical protein
VVHSSAVPRMPWHEYRHRIRLMDPSNQYDESSARHGHQPVAREKRVSRLPIAVPNYRVHNPEDDERKTLFQREATVELSRIRRGLHKAAQVANNAKPILQTTRLLHFAVAVAPSAPEQTLRDGLHIAHRVCIEIIGETAAKEPCPNLVACSACGEPLHQRPKSTKEVDRGKQ